MDGEMEGQCRGELKGNGVGMEEVKKGKRVGKQGQCGGGGMEGAPISCSSNEYFMFGDM